MIMSQRRMQSLLVLAISFAFVLPRKFTQFIISFHSFQCSKGERTRSNSRSDIDSVVNERMRA